MSHPTARGSNRPVVPKQSEGMPATSCWFAVAAQLCGLAVHAAAGLCPGFDSRNQDIYRTPSTLAQGNQGE